jgi:hypothetical protein
LSPFEADLDEFEQRLATLVDATEIAARIPVSGKLLQSIVDRAGSLLNAKPSSLFLVDPVRHDLFSNLWHSEYLLSMVLSGRQQLLGRL